MRFEPDWSLRLRMLLALAGTAALYAAVVGVAAAWASQRLGSVAVLFVIGVAGVLVALHLRYGPSTILGAVDAERVSPSEYPDLHARVSRLSAQADVPTPDVAVAPLSAPNAFATARGQRDAVIVVTEGLLETVDGAELDAVLAHEIAHVKHRDALVLTVVTTLVTVGYTVVRHFWWFGDGGGDGGGGDGQPWILAFVAVSALAWIGGYLLTRAVSRQREFAADRGAAAITGRPGAMAGAIETITEEMRAAPDDDLREHAELNALYLVPADADSRLLDLLRTHPDPDSRVDRLASLEADFESE